MKVGDIIVNPWVPRDFNGKLNPMYATIYIGNNRSIDYKGRVHAWVDKVYRDDLERKWEIIGHCDPYVYLYEQIANAIEPPKEGKDNG